MNETINCEAPDITAKKVSNPAHLGLYNLPRSWLAKRAVHVTLENSTVFQAHHFKDLTDHMLKLNSNGQDSFTLRFDFLKILYGYIELM